MKRYMTMAIVKILKSEIHLTGHQNNLMFNKIKE